jgi:hypothetical protein
MLLDWEEYSTGSGRQSTQVIASRATRLAKQFWGEFVVADGDPPKHGQVLERACQQS